MLEYVMENFGLFYLVMIFVTYMLEVFFLGVLTSETTDDVFGNPAYFMIAIFWFPCLIVAIGVGFMALLFSGLHLFGLAAFSLGAVFRRK